VDYFFTEQQQMIIDTAREITNEKIIPVRAELDEKNEFPKEILKDIAKADLFSIFVPEEYGGFGGGCYEIVLAMEELARGCVGVATVSLPARWAFSRCS
jgi:alkylation response protein AidB-like acyl-CoA dehydrogenase